MSITESRTYQIVNEVFNAITHGLAFGLSIAGLVILIVSAHGDGALKVVSFTIYGSTLVLVFLFSTLYHSLYFTGAKHVFKILDHSSIYLIIAGTYTPLCLVTLGGAFGWALFGVLWGMAILGIIYESIWIGRFKALSVAIYVVMGWMCLINAKGFYQSLTHTGFMLLLGGGLAFTVGVIFYAMKKVPFAHVIWHTFVILGAILMFFSILYYA
ncbi:MAG: hemolysin III family protein [Deferribacteraceae bacterium]|jgi:hemolysin III|nr:hemolysin III family protein [Deferribacteraceae bacterium]